MARFKLVDRSPRFLPIVLEFQLIPGSFEHALDILVDTEIDFSRLAKRFCNDETGAPAYDPAVMLKIVLLAYSRGVISSRQIERLCRENVLFMAVSGDSTPQFSTIATFVRELGDEASAIFTRVLLTCDRQGLIGRQMFAIDGVKLPSNADKKRSGTHAELRHEAERMEKAVTRMVKAHRAAVDAKAQIIVAARAHGSGSEQSVLLPVVQSAAAIRTGQTLITADAGHHSEENLKRLYELGVPALIADGLMRRRDERLADQAKYKELTHVTTEAGLPLLQQSHSV